MRTAPGAHTRLVRLKGNETLAIPHVSVPDIRWVDWAAVKRAGFKGAAFDKDNTLTLPFLEQVCLHDAS